MDIYGAKTLHRTARPLDDKPDPISAVVDTVRVLTAAQDHFTTEDVSKFFHRYPLPPQNAEFMLSPDTILDDIYGDDMSIIFLPCRALH